MTNSSGGEVTQMPNGAGRDADVKTSKAPDRKVIHVHTERCGHAFGSDREMIQACVDIGAKSVTVTDHAPFPGNPFRNRMSYEGLSEYIAAFRELRNEYEGVIDIHIGLETEYFPKYDSYYRELNGMSELDAGLLLGQHMYYKDGRYSFHMSGERLDREEFEGLGNAIIEGAGTGYFRAIAHPDRIFRRIKKWDERCTEVSKGIIDAAYRMEIPIEINIASMHEGLYYEEFWELAFSRYPDIKTYVGADAHSVDAILELADNPVWLEYVRG